MVLALSELIDIFWLKYLFIYFLIAFMSDISHLLRVDNNLILQCDCFVINFIEFILQFSHIFPQTQCVFLILIASYDCEINRN